MGKTLSAAMPPRQALRTRRRGNRGAGHEGDNGVDGAPARKRKRKRKRDIGATGRQAVMA